MKTCEECDQPFPLPANSLILELYSFYPIRPIPMSELIMLDLTAVEFLMNVYDLKQEERKPVLEKLVLFHNALTTKEFIPEEKTKEI